MRFSIRTVCVSIVLSSLSLVVKSALFFVSLKFYTHIRTICDINGIERNQMNILFNSIVDITFFFLLNFKIMWATSRNKTSTFRLFVVDCMFLIIFVFLLKAVFTRIDIDNKGWRCMKFYLSIMVRTVSSFV